MTPSPSYKQNNLFVYCTESLTESTAHREHIAGCPHSLYPLTRPCQVRLSSVKIVYGVKSFWPRALPAYREWQWVSAPWVWPIRGQCWGFTDQSEARDERNFSSRWTQPWLSTAEWADHLTGITLRLRFLREGLQLTLLRQWLKVLDAVNPVNIIWCHLWCN